MRCRRSLDHQHRAAPGQRSQHSGPRVYDHTTSDFGHQDCGSVLQGSWPGLIQPGHGRRWTKVHSTPPRDLGPTIVVISHF